MPRRSAQQAKIPQIGPGGRRWAHQALPRRQPNSPKDAPFLLPPPKHAVLAALAALAALSPSCGNRAPNGE